MRIDIGLPDDLFCVRDTACKLIVTAVGSRATHDRVEPENVHVLHRRRDRRPETVRERECHLFTH